MYCSISLVPRPFHHPVFDRLQYAKTEGGKGHWLKGRILRTRSSFLTKSTTYTFRFTNVQNSSTWGRNYKIRPLARSFDGGPLPPSVYLGRHWHHSRDKWYQAFPLYFAYCKRSKTGRWEGLGMRLLFHLPRLIIISNTVPRPNHITLTDTSPKTAIVSIV